MYCCSLIGNPISSRNDAGLLVSLCFLFWASVAGQKSQKKIIKNISEADRSVSFLVHSSRGAEGMAKLFSRSVYREVTYGLPRSRNLTANDQRSIRFLRLAGKHT